MYPILVLSENLCENLFAFPEEREELQEEIDKVEIESECPEDSLLSVFFGSFIAEDIHVFDLLCVICRECHENDNPDDGYNHICHTIFEPEIYETCHDDTKKSE